MAISGCGGDDEQAASTPTATTPVETATVETAPTETAEQETETAGQDDGAGSGGGAEAMPGGGEDQPGGAGDEEPARTLALFTGRDGRITPRVVRVPAFISIQVEVRAGDGATYGLRFGEKTIEAGGELSSSSTTLDGLRPGKSITGEPTGAGNSVRIEATAEPGP